MGELIFRKDGTAQGVAKQRLIETIAKPEERIINAVIPYKVKFSFERLKNDILKFDHDDKYLLKVLER